MFPGDFRTGRGSVNLGNGEEFVPEPVDLAEEKIFLDDLMTSNRTTTDKALTLRYHNMRSQLFWDGNKRTSTLVANKIMIDGGAGLINVPLDEMETWNDLLSSYYKNNDMHEIKQWSYEHIINGPKFDA